MMSEHERNLLLVLARQQAVWLMNPNNGTARQTFELGDAIHQVEQERVNMELLVGAAKKIAKG